MNCDYGRKVLLSQVKKKGKKWMCFSQLLYITTIVYSFGVTTSFLLRAMYFT